MKFFIWLIILEAKVTVKNYKAEDLIPSAAPGMATSDSMYFMKLDILSTLP